LASNLDEYDAFNVFLLLASLELRFPVVFYRNIYGCRVRV